MCTNKRRSNYQTKEEENMCLCLWLCLVCAERAEGGKGGGEGRAKRPPTHPPTHPIYSTQQYFIPTHLLLFLQHKSTTHPPTHPHSDFQFEKADTWYKNLDKLIHYVNFDGRLNAFYSTPIEYTETRHKEQLAFSTKNDDFFPYAVLDGLFHLPLLLEAIRTRHKQLHANHPAAPGTGCLLLLYLLFLLRQDGER